MKRQRHRIVRHVTKRPHVPAEVFVPHFFEKHIELIEGESPVVLVTREAYSRMYHIVDLSEEEVGWLGTVERTERGNFVIKEIFILKQEVSGATTEISEDGLAELGHELMTSREDGADVFNSIRFWGHSHVRMDTHASRQDDDQMKLFRENGCPWFIRGILNKSGSMRFTIYLYDAGIRIIDAPWLIFEFIEDTARAEIEAELKAKVTRQSFRAPSHPHEGASYSMQPLNEEGGTLVHVGGGQFVYEGGDCER